MTPQTGRSGSRSRPPNVGRGWLALLSCLGTTGCFHETRAWPIALDPGSAVTVSFAQPRAVGIGNDSVLVVAGLSGSVRGLHSDTLIVNLTNVTGDVARNAWKGRVAAFTLDSSTTVVHTEFNKGSIPLVIIAALVGFYAFIGSLPP
jgi:hypothetical protein